MKTASPMLSNARAAAKTAVAFLATQSNATHAQEALSRLTDEWKPLCRLRLTPESGVAGFAELVAAGLAQVRFDRTGKPGQRIFYRRMPEGGAALTPRAQRRHSRKAAA